MKNLFTRFMKTKPIPKTQNLSQLNQVQNDRMTLAFAQAKKGDLLEFKIWMQQRGYFIGKF
jgi:hypothetical protein